MPRLSAEIAAAPSLPEGLLQAMFDLFSGYYDGADPARFLSDLQDKQQVILLYDRERVLRGFSTLAVVQQDHNGRALRAVFSGDTIVHHAYWGEQTLAFAWIRLAGRIKAERPEQPLYWFLIVKGHRTYRYLHAFTHRYYPSWWEPTPTEQQALMDTLAVGRFKDCYDPRRGVVRFPRSLGHLKPAWAAVGSDDCRRPEVRFFLERNPGYVRGEELVCLTELHPDNLYPRARRLFLQGMRA